MILQRPAIALEHNQCVDEIVFESANQIQRQLLNAEVKRRDNGLHNIANRDIALWVEFIQKEPSEFLNVELARIRLGEYRQQST